MMEGGKTSTPETMAKSSLSILLRYSSSGSDKSDFWLGLTTSLICSDRSRFRNASICGRRMLVCCESGSAVTGNTCKPNKSEEN